jgi:hypothetical protein
VAYCLAAAESLKEPDMLKTRNKMIVPIGVICFSVIHTNVALSKTVGLAGSDQTKTLDCAGGWARIAGANNHVTLTAAALG